MSRKIINLQEQAEESSNEMADMIFVYDYVSNGAEPVGVVRINCNISGELYSENPKYITGDYYISGITRLSDGRYVRIIFGDCEYALFANVISEKEAFLTILQYEREELLEQKMFEDLKERYKDLVREMKN